MDQVLVDILQIQNIIKLERKVGNDVSRATKG